MHADTRRNINTLKSLHGKKRAEHIWIYYRYYILAAAFAIFVVILFTKLLIDGQRDYRLRVCVVLDNEYSCGSWFDDFEADLTSDEIGGQIDVNEDQPFDYDNTYYYVMELEVMSTISSYRMDIAICGPDMFSYLLALDACLPLDTALPEDLYADLDAEGRIVYETAGLQIQDDGSIDDSGAKDGYFAVDLTGTDFYEEYGVNDDGNPLYAVIISNTEATDDCITLIRSLTE